MDVLRRGSRGTLVTFLQGRLNQDFYVSNEGTELREDGAFGPRTEAAVVDYAGRRLQNSQNIVDGPFWRSLGVNPAIEHSVPLVGQPTDMLCWSAAASMAMRSVMSVSPGGANLATPTRSAPRGDGLEGSEANIRTFVSSLGWSLRGPPGEGEIAGIVRSKPIWMAGQFMGRRGPTSSHAVCISGVITCEVRAGFNNDVLVRIHDPWPPMPRGATSGGGTVYWAFYHVPQMMMNGDRYRVYGVAY